MMKLLFFAFFLILYSNFAFTKKSKLDRQEVKALKEIWEKLGLAGKKEWDFDHDPCSGEVGWYDYVSCDCTFETNATCRVTKLFLRSQNISTSLPLEFTKLRYLQELELNGNYLTGTIPSEWATMSLSTLVLDENRLSGSFPATLFRMTTLVDLAIAANQFSGPIPPEIANLTNLRTLAMSSNDFTGQLPPALAKLTNLTDLRISDNNFTGKIPDYISRWTQIKSLHMIGCSFEGPLPSSISSLTDLNDIRISDLKGESSTFPLLEQLTKLNVLILRNCLIHGTIPNFVGNLRSLTTLDLSFNNLTGEIPLSISDLTNVEYFFFTENNLTGRMPEWVFSSTRHVDVSYNHFTWDDASGPKTCEQGKLNTVESYISPTNEQKNIHPCLRKDFPCTTLNAQFHSLHINCGGDEIVINNTIKYEADIEREGASSYYNDGNWAFSSTGNFNNDDYDAGVYILSNKSILHNISTFDTNLYTRARTAATSLTYYGLCLMNGNYTVKLHFAEIFFTTYNSSVRPGKRVFDVYVQGKLELKDFDIVKEAGGAGSAVIKSFTVIVKNNTLKIQLYWAGKGTTIVPLIANYGPIISAISVDPNFKLPNKIEAVIVVGTFCGGIFIVLITIIILWRKGYLRRWGMTDGALRASDLKIGTFTLTQIKEATKNFDPSNKLGEGGFGTVYKGQLSDRSMIAVKELSSQSSQGTREFMTEIGALAALKHPNLVRLYGCCVAEKHMSLVYEYMENNCLYHALLGTDEVSKAKLTWRVRYRICKGIARGLAYLHEEAPVTIIHRDIKASNVLLSRKLRAKISDFGLARLYDTEYTHIITRVAGTVGYMAPEYAMRGNLSPKVDVYSFGIVLLEIVTGKSNSYRPPSADDQFYLLEWVGLMNQQRTLLALVDPDLGLDYSPEGALMTLQVAILCVEEKPNLRPPMSLVVAVFEGRSTIKDLLDYQHVVRSQNSLGAHFREDDDEICPMSGEEPTDLPDNSEIRPVSVEEPTDLPDNSEIRPVSVEEPTDLPGNNEIHPVSVEEPTDSPDNNEIRPVSVEEPTDASFVVEIS